MARPVTYTKGIRVIRKKGVTVRVKKIAVSGRRR